MQYINLEETIMGGIVVNTNGQEVYVFPLIKGRIGLDRKTRQLFQNLQPMNRPMGIVDLTDTTVDAEFTSAAEWVWFESDRLLDWLDTVYIDDVEPLTLIVDELYTAGTLN